MYIDPRLAKGLSNRLFNELPERVEQRVTEFVRSAEKIRMNSTAMEKISRLALDVFKQDALVVYLGGSNKHPYLGITTVCVLKERVYKDWEENSVIGTSVVLTAPPLSLYQGEPRFRISQHAVARLYQRTSNDLKRDQSIDLNLVLPELKQVPLWTGYWLWTLHCLNHDNGVETINPVIPTPNGLLFAECSLNSLTVEIRTFVGDNLLSDDQLQIKKILLSAGEKLASSPLAVGLQLVRHALDDISIDADYLSAMIASSGSQLSRFIFPTDTPMAIDKFSDWLGNRPYGNDDFVKLIQAQGIRKAHTTIRSATA